MNRVDVAFEFIKDTKGKILDIGCGTGITASKLADDRIICNHVWYKGNEVTGIDMLPKMIKRAKEKNNGKNIKFKVMDADNLEFPSDYFDGVVFLETIEHVRNPVKVLSDIHRILKPDGVLVISTPNAISSSSISRQMFINFSKELRKVEDEPRNAGANHDHLYSWDIITLYRLLNRCGFKYDKHKFVGVYGHGPFKKFKFDFLSPLFRKFCTITVIKVRKKGDA